MTSSTSTSEPPASDPGLRRWAPLAAATFFGGAALLYALLILIDPYDTGRFPAFPIVGVSDRNLRTSHVSRARDKRFDSAIFGSSTGQAIDPTRLGSLTGLHFTQLTFTAAAPRDILSVMDWFLRNHAGRVGAVVLAADDTWCSPDGLQPERYPFPHWLYGSDADYLASLLNWKSFDRAVWRVQLALGRRKPNDPVGFFGYHDPRPFRADPPIPPELSTLDEAAPFPWLDRLKLVLRAMPQGAALIAVTPPVFHDYLPPPGSRRAARIDRCKATLAHLAEATGHGFLVDRAIDTPDTHDEAAFYDRLHHHPPAARIIEDSIAAAYHARTLVSSTGPIPETHP